MDRQDVILTLEAAVNAYKKDTPGSWRVYDSNTCVQLAWDCEQDDPNISGMRGGEPWELWGGNEIITIAGMPEPNNSGVDGFPDKYGDAMICEWVQWNFEDNED